MAPWLRVGTALARALSLSLSTHAHSSQLLALVESIASDSVGMNITHMCVHVCMCLYHVCICTYIMKNKTLIEKNACVVTCP